MTRPDIQKLFDLEKELERIKDDDWPTLFSASVRTILSAIAAIKTEAVAEAGWVRVPVEPTEAMIVAGQKPTAPVGTKLTGESVISRYHAMLAAASADRAYIAGMKVGWNYGVDENVEGFQKVVEGRLQQKRDALAASPSPAKGDV